MLKKEKNTCGINIRNIYMDRNTGTENRLRLCVFSPSESGKYDTGPGKLPCLVWFHGGGFGQGVPEVELAYIKVFMKMHPCIAIVPAYRLSIENQYPAAVNDCYDALLYVYSNEFLINPEQDDPYLQHIVPLRVSQPCPKHEPY